MKGCGRKIGPYPCCSVVCEDSFSAILRIPHNDIDLILADPPYGINHATDYHSRGRGELAICKDYPPVIGDDHLFDPHLFLHWPGVWWGANYYADRLPASAGWLVWDKERPDTLDQSTCELAWTNFVKGVRRFRFLWNGMIRASDEELVHPTQKPVALTDWILSLPWTPCGVILDPFCGSGSSLVSAKKAGRHFLGMELSPDYVRISEERIALVEMQPNLFTPKPKQITLL